MVFNPKNGRTDYSTAKAFRPISLTSFLIKTLERMVDRYLVERIISADPLHENQHAYRRGRSTETALHAVVSKIERSLHHKDVALAVFFDVEGAFDKARPTNICNALRTRGAAPSVIEWIRSALEERNVTTAVGDSELYIGVRGGCPQGSCPTYGVWLWMN